MRLIYRRIYLVTIGENRLRTERRTALEIPNRQRSDSMFKLLSKIQRRRNTSTSEHGSDDMDDRDAIGGTPTVESGQTAAVDRCDTERTVKGDELPVSFDAIFGMLQNERRRRVLRVLDEDDQIRLGKIAERIAVQENDKVESRFTAQERKRVYIALYQFHLPKLANVDAITYNKARGIVSRGPAFHIFASYLPDDPAQATSGPQDSQWTDYIPHILK